MNKIRYTEGDRVMRRDNRLLAAPLAILAVMLVLGGVLAGQGHAQTLRTVEQEVIQIEEPEAGEDTEVTRQSAVEGVDSSAAEDSVQSDSSMSREKFMAMVADEVVMAPGIGLQHIRLGEPLESVKSRLGPPRSISRSGFLPRYYVLTYLLDGGTTVQLVGRKVVERIQVTGNSAALIRTTQGARFGMDPALIQRIYRTPTKQSGNRLEYRNRGITFYFAEQGGGQGLSDGVSRIEIYRPGARGST